MRVQPERPIAPLLTTTTSRSGAARSRCSTQRRPAPPLPITATSVSMVGMSSLPVIGEPLQPPATQQADRSGGVEPLGADRGAGVDVAAAQRAVATGDLSQPLL